VVYILATNPFVVEAAGDCGAPYGGGFVCSLQTTHLHSVTRWYSPQEMCTLKWPSLGMVRIAEY